MASKQWKGGRCGVLSDIHGDQDSLEKITSFFSKEGVDYMFVAGDLLHNLYTKEGYDKYHKDRAENVEEAKRNFQNHIKECSKIKLNSMKSVLDSVKAPYIVVHGNYDPDMSEYFPSEYKQSNEAIVYEKELKMFCNGGSYIGPPTFHFLQNNMQGTLGKYEPKAKLDGAIDVAITHTPPMGYCSIGGTGGEEGEFMYTAAMQKHMPKVWFCGHAHASGPYAHEEEKHHKVSILQNDYAGIALYKGGDGQNTYVVNTGNSGRFNVTSDSLDQTFFESPFYGSFGIATLDKHGFLTELDFYSIGDKKSPGKVVELASYDKDILRYE